MPQFFLNKKLIAILLGIILLVSLIGYTLRDRVELTFLERFTKDTTGFFHNIIDKPVSSASNFISTMTKLKTTYEENANLKSKLESQVALEAEVYELKKENEELKALNELKGSLSDKKTITATVIGKNPDQYQAAIIINKGSENGVNVNDAVMTSTGLIGKVKTVTNFQATVQLLNSDDLTNRVAAEIQDEKSIFGFIKGYDKESGCLILTEIDKNLTITLGKVVVTSGKGGVFPKGLVIGVVEKVMVDSIGLSQNALVKPYANFYDFNNVLVVERTVEKVPSADGGEPDL